MDSKQFEQYGRPLLNTKAGTDAGRIERFGRSGYAGIQFDTTVSKGWKMGRLCQGSAALREPVHEVPFDTVIVSGLEG